MSTPEQPILRRLLGIQCLLEATEQSACTTDVIRSINRLTRRQHLQALASSLKNAFENVPTHPVHRLSYHQVEDKTDGMLLIHDPDRDGDADGDVDMAADDPHGDDPKKILPGHIRGEAYELLCAMVFKCKSATSAFALADYHADYHADVPHADADDGSPRLPYRDCHVSRTFLSETRYEQHSWLRWTDNREHWENYVAGRLEPYLNARIAHLEAAGNPAAWRRARALVTEIAGKFSDNVTADIGFDLLVELEEELEEGEVDGVPERHFVLAQAKYRSNEYSEVSMAEYVGKYYNLVHLLETFNKLAGGRPTLMPFFWISTVSQPDAMNYFTALKDAGKVQFYGNLTFELDNGVLNLVSNVKSEMKSWLARCVREEDRAAAFRHVIQEPRPPRPHQEKAVKHVLEYCKEDAQSKTSHDDDVYTTTKTLGAMTLTTPTPRKMTRAAVVMATGSGKTYTSFLSVIELERDERLGVARDVRAGGMAASIHFSPMIRLVIQNAHEWLADERKLEAQQVAEQGAEQGAAEGKFYYCICSMRDDRASLSSGCTAVRMIETTKLPDVFRHHRRRGSLHRCRFFTTYQASKALLRVTRRINLDNDALPNAPLFGLAIYDEAHKTVGRGTKPFSAALLIEALIGLSYTASAIYSFHHLKLALPDTFGLFDSEDKELVDLKATYLSVDSSYLFPHLPAGTVAGLSRQTGLYDCVEWNPMDTLSGDSLFVELADDEKARLFPDNHGEPLTWADFERLGHDTTTVVFIVHDTPDCEVNGVSLHSLVLDKNDEPRYFGVIGCAVDRSTQCLGINAAGTRLFRANGGAVGFSLNDFSGIGPTNRIGPVVHQLSYQQSFADEILVRPRVYCMERQAVEVDPNDHGHWNTVFAGAADFSEATPKAPKNMTWTLTISRTLETASQHVFRSMKLLVDLYATDDNIKRCLVFCKDTDESKTCRSIFNLLWEDQRRRAAGASSQQGQSQEGQSAPTLTQTQIHTDIIFSSATEGGSDGAKETMQFDEQQEKLSKFTASPRAVLFNVKLISIGVDLPSVDTVMIVNPSFTSHDVTQKIGRALRKNPRDPTKAATVIIPCWDPTDGAVTDPAPAAPANDHPGHPDHDEANDNLSVWRAPVHYEFEDTFGIAVRVVDAMLDEEVDMITSYSSGVRERSGAPKGQKDNETHVRGILAKLRGANEPPDVPVFDEWFSSRILQAWAPKLLTVDDGTLGREAPRRGPAPGGSKQDLKLATCNAVILVAFVAYCEDSIEMLEGNTHSGRVTPRGAEVTDVAMQGCATPVTNRTGAEVTMQGTPSGTATPGTGVGAAKSSLWYKTSKPFDGGASGRLAWMLDADVEAEAQGDVFKLFGFDGSDSLSRAVRARGRDGGPGGHRTLTKLREDAFKVPAEEWSALLAAFHARLDEDQARDQPVHATVLHGFCHQAWPTMNNNTQAGYTIRDIFVGGFDSDAFRAFCCDEENYRKAKRKTTGATTSKAARSKSTKRKLDLDDIEAGDEAESQQP